MRRRKSTALDQLRRKAMLKGIPGELDIGSETELGRNASTIGRDGLVAKSQLGRDFFDGLARGNETQHFHLAIGKSFVRITLDFPVKARDKFFGEEGSDVFSAREGFPCGGDQFVRGAVFC